MLQPLICFSVLNKHKQAIPEESGMTTKEETENDDNIKLYYLFLHYCPQL